MVHTKWIVTNKIYQPKGIFHRICGIYCVKESTCYLDLVLQEGKIMEDNPLSWSCCIPNLYKGHGSDTDITLIQTFIVTKDDVLPYDDGFDQPFDMTWVNSCTGVGSIR
jgi:hypothetical protein